MSPSRTPPYAPVSYAPAPDLTMLAGTSGLNLLPAYTLTETIRGLNTQRCP